MGHSEEGKLNQILIFFSLSSSQDARRFTRIAKGCRPIAWKSALQAPVQRIYDSFERNENKISN